MGISAVVAAVTDAVATDAVVATVADVATTAVADVAVSDAVGAAVTDAVAAGATDAGVAAAADAAGTAAADAAATGATTDAAAAAGADAGASTTAVETGAVAPTADTTAAAVAPVTDANGLTILDQQQTAELMKNVDPNLINSLQPVEGATEGAAVPESTVANVEVTPEGDVVNGVQTGANPTEAVSPTTGPVTDANGNVLADAGGPGQAPVYDANPVPAAGAGTADPTLGTALGHYADAVAGSLGTAGLVGAGALGAAMLSGALAPTPSLSGNVGSGSVNYTWGQGTPLQSGGLNPGYIGGAASIPYYNTGNPTDAQYYWGVHAPVNTAADLANYNQQAGAPATPWGAGAHAVGGQGQFNPANFVNQYILNPGWTGVNNATSPGYTGPAVPVKG